MQYKRMVHIYLVHKKKCTVATSFGCLRFVDQIENIRSTCDLKFGQPDNKRSHMTVLYTIVSITLWFYEPKANTNTQPHFFGKETSTESIFSNKQKISFDQPFTLVAPLATYQESMNFLFIL